MHAHTFIHTHIYYTANGNQHKHTPTVSFLSGEMNADRKENTFLKRNTKKIRKSKWKRDKREGIEAREQKMEDACLETERRRHKGGKKEMKKEESSGDSKLKVLSHCFWNCRLKSVNTFYSSIWNVN